MPKQLSIILPSPWANQRDGTRLSLAQFSELIQYYLTHITEAQDSMHFVSTPFKEKGGIRPVQCRRAVYALDKMNEQMQEFCELLNETSYLPVVFIALRYRLLVPLQLIEEEACELIDLINSYRAICMTSSHHALQQRREIIDAFETLLEHITDILQKADFLGDESKFQEQKLQFHA